MSDHNHENRETTASQSPVVWVSGENTVEGCLNLIETSLQRVPYDPRWIANEGEAAMSALAKLREQEFVAPGGVEPIDSAAHAPAKPDDMSGTAKQETAELSVAEATQLLEEAIRQGERDSMLLDGREFRQWRWDMYRYALHVVTTSGCAASEPASVPLSGEQEQAQ